MTDNNSTDETLESELPAFAILQPGGGFKASGMFGQQVWRSRELAAGAAESGETVVRIEAVDR